MTEAKTRLAVSALAIVDFVFLLGGNAVRYATGGVGFVALALVLLGLNLWLLLRERPTTLRWYRLPAPLTLFLALATVSILWSAYPAESVLGVLAQLSTTLVAVTLAFVLTWAEFLRTLGTALRYLIGGSLVFELIVSLWVRHPLLPWWQEVPEGKISKLLYWSRDLLFEGGPIQGLLGNSALFGFLALLGLIVFGVQLRAGLVRPVPGWFWVGIAVLSLGLTRAATVTVALFVVLLALGFALWARRLTPAGRVPLYATATAVAAAGLVAVLFFRDALFGLLGKSGDMTGRLEIWHKVIDLAEQRPAFGWGWISYWAPWVEPFLGLDEKVGLPVMHAHNAWLDVWLQLGVVGVVLFAMLAGLTLWRVWFRAIDQPRRDAGPPLSFATSSLVPLLLVVALLVQSLTESRLLIEGGWLLLTLLAMKSKTDYQIPSLETEPRVAPWRDVPLTSATARGQRG